MDVYVFATQAEADFVDRMQEASPPALRFAAATTGGFQAFAVVRVGELRDLPATLRETFQGTISGTETAVPLRFGPYQVKWKKPRKHVSFSRIRTKPGRANEVLGLTSTGPAYNGSAIVAGSFDVLLEYTAEELADLQNALANALHGTRGIAWSDTVIVAGEPFYREEQAN